MHDLKCGQKDCLFNKGYSCTSKEIHVSNGTECLTFSKKQQTQGDDMFEAATEYSKPNYNVDTKVGCHAPCLFNKSNMCIANGITVTTDSQDAGCAECLTFIKD